MENTGYFGVHNCSRNNGISAQNNDLNVFGYTKDDPNRRDQKWSGKNWRVLYIPLNNEGSQQTVGKTKVGEIYEMLKNIENKYNIEWEGQSKEYFSIPKENFNIIYKNIIEIFIKYQGNL